jgi:hypothetical protein
MLTPINLNHQARRDTGEIGHMGRNRVLAAELGSRERA